MTAAERTALVALDALIDAAVGLDDAWTKIGPFDVLSENVAPDFTEWGEQLDALIAWRDRTHAALGIPPGPVQPEAPPAPYGWTHAGGPTP